MGNKDKKVIPNFATFGTHGVFLTKNEWKKSENVTCGCVFDRKKKTNNIRGFLNKFSKNEQISPIGKADYLLMCSFKVCFLEIFVMLNVGQHYNLRNYLTL